jgi:hypothetical protein
MAKLTLSVDGRVVTKAKRYAKQQGVSVSEMVESYLLAVAEPNVQPSPVTPILRSLRGSLKRAHVEEYRQYLTTKYR